MPLSLDSVTLNAYLLADYRVLTPVPMTLRIGLCEPLLSEWLALHAVTQAVLITAHNPRSQRLGEADNAHRQQSLEDWLAQHGWVWSPTVGRDPAGEWPDEPGCLVLGMNAKQGVSLGRQWQQNAIVCCGSDGIPQLQLIDY